MLALMLAAAIAGAPPGSLRDAPTVRVTVDSTRHEVIVVAGWWDLIANGAEPLVDAEDADFVKQALAMLPPKPWTAATWGDWTNAVKEATGRKGKGLYRPLRRALTGRDAGPEMADLMPLLQKLRLPA